MINVSRQGLEREQGRESLRDTALTLAAMGADALVIRHPASRRRRTGWPSWIDRASVVNAGDGTHEHPTQALLDAYTLRQRLGDARRAGTVAIVGDVLHSRVARSNVLLLATLGAEVTLVAPPTLLPVGVDGVAEPPARPRPTTSTPCCPSADAVMMLRVQARADARRRSSRPRGSTAVRYGLDAARARRCCPTDAVVCTRAR